MYSTVAELTVQGGRIFEFFERVCLSRVGRSFWNDKNIICQQNNFNGPKTDFRYLVQPYYG